MNPNKITIAAGVVMIISAILANKSVDKNEKFLNPNTGKLFFALSIVSGIVVFGSVMKAGK